MKALDLDRLAARVSARLGELAPMVPSDRTTIPAAAACERANPYERSAAVLAWFEPAQLPDPVPPLAPTEPAGFCISSRDARAALIDQLLLHSRIIQDPGGQPRWAMSPEHRIRVLRQLREEGGLVSLPVIPTERPDSLVQQLLDAGLQQQPLPFDPASMTALQTATEVAGWLHAAGFTVQPGLTQLRGQLEWRALLKGFEHLAGTQFAGRSVELARLRGFVGVIAPVSLAEAGSRIAHHVVQRATELLRRSPTTAMVISGPGGVGKSTLVARFLLEHARAHASERFPFAYLDFDRAELSADEPLSLLAEVLRQLGVQYPDERDNSEALRRSWLDALGRAMAQHEAPRLLDSLRRTAIGETARICRRIDAQRPVVVVLDTFEEVQYRGARTVLGLRQFLEQLRAAIPGLRLVIASRSELDWPRIEHLALAAFDEAAAVAFLKQFGLGAAGLARQVYRRLGGSPLTLKLAAELHREAPDPGLLGAISVRDAFFRRLSDEHIQRQLYRRVLAHIHDPQVRRLAHPGLVLRRISPELILEVLARPCGLAVTSPDEALALFEALKREVALVSVQPDGSVRHRQDLRLLMLAALNADAPAQTRQIHEAAVAWYARRDTDLERAEEIYHRLWLKQPYARIKARWRPGVRRWLFAAVAELDPARRAFLAARLPMAIDAQARSAARLEDWEQIVARAVNEAVAAGEPAGALTLLEEREARTAASVLVLPEARTRLVLGQTAAAVSTLEAGYARALAAGKRQAAGQSLLALATVLIQHRLIEGAARTERQLAELLPRLGLASRLQGLAQRVFLAADALSALPLETELTALLETSETRLPRLKTAAYWAAAAPGAHAARRVLLVVGRLGLPPLPAAALRALAPALAQCDQYYSRLSALPPGAVARRLELPVRDSLTETWSEFLSAAPTLRISSALRIVLTLEPAATSVELIGALQELLLQTLIWRAGTPDLPHSDATGPVMFKVRASQLQELASAIGAEFELETLRELLQHRLQRTLEAYTADADLLELLAVAQAEGWLLQLLMVLVEARPDSIRLARLASALGIRGADFQSLLQQALRDFAGRGSLDADPAWCIRLQHLQRCVCRIEVENLPRGTGFLVGADLLLTADFVIDAVLSGDLPASSVQLRFDYKNHRSNQHSGGSVFRASRLLAHGGRELPYALLRVEGKPGVMPIGAASGYEAAAVLRRWIEPPAQDPPIEAGEPWLILHHPLADVLVPGFGQVAGGPPLRADFDTAPGSSGAPIFAARSLQLLAMQISTDRTGTNAAFALSLAQIRADLVNKGLGHLLHERFA